jgi:hypothetical protein
MLSEIQLRVTLKITPVLASDKPHYVAHRLALLDTARTLCCVRDRCYHTTPVCRQVTRMLRMGFP